MTPTSFRFPGQHANERILRVVHRHWLDLFSHLAPVALFSLLLLGSLLLLPLLFPDFIAGTWGGFILFVENTFLLAIWIYGFLAWIDCYFDVWILTDKRIVNIEQRGLFARQTSELSYARIQDATASVLGFIPTVFNYGDLFVQSASAESHIQFRHVPDPLRLKEEILRLSRGGSAASSL